MTKYTDEMFFENVNLASDLHCASRLAMQI